MSVRTNRSTLAEEAQKLSRSWMRHDGAELRDYLVAGEQDPRINIQSILSRHYLLAELFGERFTEVFDQELRFGAAMTWLVMFGETKPGADGYLAMRHALVHGADDAEGFPVPAFMLRAFGSLPTQVAGIPVPNYISEWLSLRAESPDGKTPAEEAIFALFLNLWRQVMPAQAPKPISVVEPACGSANDYRAMAACGLGAFMDYTGFDLCEKNVLNARALFPKARFEVSNAFDTGYPDESFDHCVVHDLFEHLSPAAMEAAIAELCRVTRHGMCLGFFQMHEGSDHIVRPVDEYHWNTLSLDRVKALLHQHGAKAQTLHINTFMETALGFGPIYNPNAYTLMVTRMEE